MRPLPARHEVKRGPLWGLRRKPGRAALALFRMPCRAYEHDAGWMLGRTFLEFTHAGRKSGQQYATVAMVLSYDEPCQEAVICAAWGPETDWVRNLRAGSMTTVNIARDSFTARHQFLSNDEAFAVAQAFRRRHPHRLHTMQRLLGWGDLNDDATLRKFVEGHPMVRFSPERIADSVNHEEVHGHAGFDLPRTR